MDEKEEESTAESVLAWAMKPENAEALRAMREAQGVGERVRPMAGLLDSLTSAYENPVLRAVREIERSYAPIRAAMESLDSPAVRALREWSDESARYRALLPSLEERPWRALESVRSFSEGLAASLAVGETMSRIAASSTHLAPVFDHGDRWASLRVAGLLPDSFEFGGLANQITSGLLEENFAAFRSVTELAGFVPKLSFGSPLDSLLGGFSVDSAEPFGDAVEAALGGTAGSPTVGGDELLAAERQRVTFSDARLKSLMDAIVQDPRLRYTIHWRDFERIVAEILEAEGYENVVLGPGFKDGGVDVVATLRTPFGRLVVAAQCKRYGERRTVEPDDVRALWGVVTDERFGQGILFTTSTFQPAARSFADRQNGRLTLDDGEQVVARLARMRA